MKKPLSNPPTDAEILQFFQRPRRAPSDRRRGGAPTRPTPRPAPTCSNGVLALQPTHQSRPRGYLTHRAFVPLSEVSDTRTLAAFVFVELRKIDPQISPVSFRYSDRYFAAECPDCRALFGDFREQLLQLVSNRSHSVTVSRPL